jgi:hypothetical protein
MRLFFPKQQLIFLTFLIGNLAYAQAPQKNIQSREQLWVSYSNQTRFTDKWGLWFDAHYRTTGNFVERPFQMLIRPALTYFISDNLRINAGYTLAKHYPAVGLKTTRTEHRAWQQIWWNQKYPGVTMLQWLRLEQRFLEKVIEDVIYEGYDYTFRIRYNLSFVIPLKGKAVVAHTPFVTVANEVFLNFGGDVIYNTFDQNRLSAGLGYQFTPHVSAQLGYTNLYQQLNSGNNYLVSHVIRLSVAHNLDFRSKSETAQK